MARLKSGAMVVSMLAEVEAACRTARQRVDLASPFISHSVARAVADASRAGRTRELRLLTALHPRSVAVGVLSTAGLRELLAAGFEIRSLPNLHAKLTLIDALGIVGSDNLTHHGLGGPETGNVELGVVLTPVQRDQAAKHFDSWWRGRQAVTLADIDKCERDADRIEVPPYRVPSYAGSSASGRQVNRPRRTRPALGLWLKMLYHFDSTDPPRDSWVSSAHGRQPDGSPRRRLDGEVVGQPSFAPGDLPRPLADSFRDENRSAVA